MKSRSPAEPEPSPRFISQPETIATLAQGNKMLQVLNEAYFNLSEEQNPSVQLHKPYDYPSLPYESIALFSIDRRPANRASTLMHIHVPGLEHSGRLDFSIDNIINRRVILSRTALGQSLREDKGEPTFRTSLMNPDHHLTWAHPLVVDTPQEPEHLVGAVQLTYTMNHNPDWNYPGNDDVEKIWRAHKQSIQQFTQSLGALATKTESLSRKLEIAPPTTPNAYVIQWDVKDSTRRALSWEYPTFDAYLEAWKEERRRITEPYGVEVLDRGEGEFIIVPFTSRVDVNSPYEIRQFGKTTIQPLVSKLLEAHDRVANAFLPTIFPKIYTGVGLGNIEEDSHDLPTGQVLWDVARMTRNNPEGQITYTEAAQIALFDNEQLPQ